MPDTISRAQLLPALANHGDPEALRPHLDGVLAELGMAHRDAFYGDDVVTIGKALAKRLAEMVSASTDPKARAIAEVMAKVAAAAETL